MIDFNLKILIIEPEQKISERFRERLDKIGFNQHQVLDHDYSMESLSSVKPGLAILGPSMDDNFTCEEVVYKLKIIAPSIQILICTGELSSEEKGYSCFEGIHSISPDPGEKELSDKIRYALKYGMERHTLNECPVIVGSSRKIIEVRKRLLQIADKDVTVLITGETGTGKELIARAIHYYSSRRNMPLVKVNCTSLPDNLVESEVFGFQKGAFTDAYQDKPGRLEQAHAGTLFIDEIGDLSLPLQVKFLQIFDDKEFIRLGGTENRSVDVRVVVATNVDLKKKVRENTFRKDLFYRINVFWLDSPSLRERKSDIFRLLNYFQHKYTYEFKKVFNKIPDNIMDFFLSYHWPGNVRELENIVKRAVALGDWSFIFNELRLDDSHSASADSVDSDERIFSIGEDGLQNLLQEYDFSLKKIKKSFVAQAEKRMILRTLEENNWNRKKAAQLLKTSYRTILSKIEEFGLKK